MASCCNNSFSEKTAKFTINLAAFGLDFFLTSADLSALLKKNRAKNGSIYSTNFAVYCLLYMYQRHSYLLLICSDKLRHPDFIGSSGFLWWFGSCRGIGRHAVFVLRKKNSLAYKKNCLAYKLNFVCWGKFLYAGMRFLYAGISAPVWDICWTYPAPLTSANSFHTRPIRAKDL